MTSFFEILPAKKNEENFLVNHQTWFLVLATILSFFHYQTIRGIVTVLKDLLYMVVCPTLKMLQLNRSLNMQRGL